VYGGYYNLSGTPPTFVITANGSGNPRIDTVVLRKDWVLQTIRLVVLTGTPAGSPLPPTLTQTPGTRWEIPLADILVNSGFVTIVQANITPRRAWANAASNIYLLDVLNNSGVPLVAGDVVKWDTTTDFSVTTSTTPSDPLTAGVWQSRTGAGSYGRLLVKGIGPVNANAAVTRGNVLAQSSTAKQAAIISAGGLAAGVFAQALQTSSGAGLVMCYVDAPLRTAVVANSASLVREGVADYTTTLATFGDVDATNLILTLSTTTGRIMVEAAAAILYQANTEVELDLILDSTTRLGGTNGTARQGTAGTVFYGWWPIFGRFTGLSIGSHNIKLQFRVLTAGQTGTIKNNAYPILMRAWEI
jgi:hypothetical protein